MAFQGTTAFPGKGIISGLEKHGVAFGQNVNAYTAHNETVYNLSSVPTASESLLDTCLLILHDWSYYLTLEDKEIDDERGVISEEWRTRRTPSFRIQAQTFPVLFKGSKYAVRDVIGSLDVIKNFKYQTIRDFYHKWYRSDLEAIAVVGDIDVQVMEDKIKKLFSKIPVVENPVERPFFSIPDHDETNYVLATDKEVSGTSIAATVRFRDLSAAEKNTVAYLKEVLIASFYNSMLNARISEIMQQETPPFMRGNIGFGGLVRGYAAYSINVVPKPNEEALAWEAILKENERVKRFGFTDSELARAKTNMLAGLESAYKQKDKVDNEAIWRI
ncbi:zinc protease PqqL [Bacteroides reticulotermitis JCM 10512]|uniref:Zinc protease PqqL n=2 Tax=Bacteroides reticulotermitis TaxID=1133319 RepID=W4USL9_9BACE|nr:zinc protease PqqL [Bacteroides reticulotermitis JCM 10512]